MKDGQNREREVKGKRDGTAREDYMPFSVPSSFIKDGETLILRREMKGKRGYEEGKMEVKGNERWVVRKDYILVSSSTKEGEIDLGRERKVMKRYG